VGGVEDEGGVVVAGREAKPIGKAGWEPGRAGLAGDGLSAAGKFGKPVCSTSGTAFSAPACCP